MQIKSLELLNFRNYESLSMEFDEGVNIIYGANAQGKTNILESIYMCSSGKSHKGSKEKEIIREGCCESHIKGEFLGRNGHDRIDVHLKNNKPKGIAINRIPIKKISDLYGKINMVIFSAEDLDIVKRGPAARRRFLDQEICQLDPVYVEDLIYYGKIKNQRAELFKRLSEKDSTIPQLMETLDIWDLQLVRYGTNIIKRRRKFIEEINEIILDIHYRITGGKEKLKIVYQPSTDEDAFYENLRKCREKDIITKNTNTGPHRDDFIFVDGNRNMRVFGSNGQQRTCALSLKLSEIAMIENIRKEKPVLLLDDVLSELDRSRQKQLLNSLKEGQTVITCTGLDEFIKKELGQTRKYLIENAKIKEA